MIRLKLMIALLLLLPLSLAAQAVHVTGQVLDSQGERGLAGARIELFAGFEDYDKAVRRLREKTDLKPQATARTDGDGLFDLTAPQPGIYRLRVEAGGAFPSRILFFF